MLITPIQTPHLPSGKVSQIISGQLPVNLKFALLKHVDEIIETTPAMKIEDAIRHHVDLSVCPLADSKIIISPEQIHLKEKLISLGYYVIISDAEPKSPYPNDSLLNFVNMNDVVICNNEIHKYANYRSSAQIITVKQGYVKCSVAPIAKNAILTDDRLIAIRAEQQGIDVCFVSKGDIRLPGYNYGFIGGCCGKISESDLVFCGNIETHRDCDKIIAFLNKYNVRAISLVNEPLLDIGSLIPLTQKKG